MVKGHTTAVFRRKGKPEREHVAFSIITVDRTLDLEAESEDVRNDWAQAVHFICQVRMRVRVVGGGGVGWGGKEWGLCVVGGLFCVECGKGFMESWCLAKTLRWCLSG